MQKNILISILISFSLIGGTLYVMSNDQTLLPSPSDIQPGENIVVREGIQYVTISARGGYFPNLTEAAANVPTKIIVRTNGTYDCSASLVIRDVGFQKILPASGEEIIDVGLHKPGDTLQGLCSMGMYNFSINFK